MDSLQRVRTPPFLVAARTLTPQQEVISLDTDIKTHFTAYQAVKSTLVSVQRKQTYPAPSSSSRVLSPLTPSRAAATSQRAPSPRC